MNWRIKNQRVVCEINIHASFNLEEGHVSCYEIHNQGKDKKNNNNKIR